MAELTGGGESSLSGTQSGAVLKNKSDTATSGQQSSQTRNVKKSKIGESDGAGDALSKVMENFNKESKDVFIWVNQNLSLLFTGSATLLASRINVGHIIGGESFELEYAA